MVVWWVVAVAVDYIFVARCKRWKGIFTSMMFVGFGVFVFLRRHLGIHSVPDERSGAKQFTGGDGAVVVPVEQRVELLPELRDFQGASLLEGKFGRDVRGQRRELGLGGCDRVAGDRLGSRSSVKQKRSRVKQKIGTMGRRNQRSHPSSKLRWVGR